tara:strand:- start:675 stop:1463 length:789 start_codon:yes stop_codon:yes gene_type:complete
MSDFYDISAKMKKLFPSNPAADLAALQEMAGAPVKDDIAVDHINESASVKKGSLPIDLDLQSFAKLAGITETQKTGPAGQLKAKDAIAKQPAMTTKNPTQDKLVGEEDDAFTTAIDNSFGQGTIAKKIGFSPRGELTKLIYRAIKAVMPQADEAEIKKAANAAADSMQESMGEDLRMNKRGKIEYDVDYSDLPNELEDDFSMSKLKKEFERAVKNKTDAKEGKSPHPKGSKKYKAHMAAMHANETTKDSIKEQLLAKLKARK